MNKHEGFVADVATGVVRIVTKYSKGYVFKYAGLLGHIEFNPDDSISSFNVRDISGVTSGFIQHIDKFNINVVSVKNDDDSTAMNLLYVEPANIRPWMVKLISAELSWFYWCIYRCRSVILNDPLFRMMGAVKDVGYYTRTVHDEIFTRCKNIEQLNRDNSLLIVPTTKTFS